MSISRVLLAATLLLPVLLRGESRTGYVHGGHTSDSVSFSNTTDSSYTVSASPTNGWVFTDHFSISGYNGWYKSGSHSASCETIDGVTTVFVDAATAFGVSIHGKMYKPGGEGGSLVDWSVSGSGSGACTPSVDPVAAIIAYGENRNFTYNINGSPAPGGMWKYSPGGGGYGGNSSGYTFPPGGSSPDAGFYVVSAARNSAGAREANASVSYVEVASIETSAHGFKIISETNNPGDNESICTEAQLSGSLTFTAHPNPSGQWPEHGSPPVSYPEWYVGDMKVQDGSDTYTFNPENKDFGVYTIKAKCGTSVKAINVYVVNPRYQIFVNEPEPGSGLPVKTFSPGQGIYSVGHSWWRIFVTPSGAKNVVPFRQYIAVISQPVGFYGNGNIFVGAGQVLAPTPSLHVPDSSYAATNTRIFNISIENAISGLIYTESIRLNPGNYVLARKMYYASVPEVDWNYDHSRNCATLSTAAGIWSGASVPSPYDEWSGMVLGINCVFWGHSPGFIGDEL